MQNKIEIGLTNTLVKKDRDLVHKAKYSLSVNSMKYLSALICMIRKDDDKFFQYSTTAKELSELIKTPITTDKLRVISNELLNLKIPFIDSKGRESGGINMFDNIIYDNDTFSIKAQFGTMARPYLLEFKNGYLKYGIQNILALRSTVIIRIYEICKDKLTCQGNIKNVVYFDISIKEFRHMLNIKEGYKYSHIKDRYLDKAVEQFKQHADIEISYKAKRKGRAVDLLQFTVKRTKQGNKDFNPILKFKEVLIRAVEPNIEPHEIWDIDFYEIGDGYCLTRANNGKLLLSDEDGRFYDSQEAMEGWAYIFENKEKESLFNQKWIKQNEKFWESK